MTDRVSEIISKVAESDFVLSALLQAIQDAAPIMRNNFRKSPAELQLITKPDDTIVTITDREVQARLIQTLQNKLTQHLPYLSFLA